ncbi:hypothetical protein Scep_002918 [Stephania cephalantha]|uniref:DUF1232 domain-containing protein n=1 Tax=Stephania cephalantha TaxID=152367 RepID=A0AAP0LAS7_9MAGN
MSESQTSLESKGRSGNSAETVDAFIDDFNRSKPREMAMEYWRGEKVLDEDLEKKSRNGDGRASGERLLLSLPRTIQPTMPGELLALVLRAQILGNCIMSVWHHGPALQPCKCPLCRRLITLLIPSQSMTGARDNSEVNGILLEIERYNRRFGGGSLTLLQIVVSIIYVLSPIDIIPEGVLGFIGFVDDILVALFFFLHIAAIYRAVLLNRHGGY